MTPDPHSHELPDDIHDAVTARILQRMTRDVLPTFTAAQLETYNAVNLVWRLDVPDDDELPRVVVVDLIDESGIHLLARFDATTVGLHIDADGVPRYDP